MSNAFIRVSSICHDLQNRYGSEDPLVHQLMEELQRAQHQAALYPAVERRQRVLPSHQWNQRLRERAQNA